jgi:hypothetical protein
MSCNAYATLYRLTFPILNQGTVETIHSLSPPFSFTVEDSRHHRSTEGTSHLLACLLILTFSEISNTPAQDPYPGKLLIYRLIIDFTSSIGEKFQYDMPTRHFLI